jgi:hypothetical protein
MVSLPSHSAAQVVRGCPFDAKLPTDRAHGVIQPTHRPAARTGKDEAASAVAEQRLRPLRNPHAMALRVLGPRPDTLDRLAGHFPPAVLDVLVRSSSNSAAIASASLPDGDRQLFAGVHACIKPTAQFGQLGRLFAHGGKVGLQLVDGFDGLAFVLGERFLVLRLQRRAIRLGLGPDRGKLLSVGGPQGGGLRTSTLFQIDERLEHH